MLSKRGRTLLVFIALLILCPSVFGQRSVATGLITLNPDKHFQTIKGFGVNVIGPWFRDDQKTMFDELIDDLGATRFRVGAYLIHTDWEEGNLYDNPELRASGLLTNWAYWDNRYSSPLFERSWALMRYLNSRGILPLIALYGPVPEWMTDDTVGPLSKAVSLDELFRKRQNHLSPRMYDAFANEVVSMLVYARSQAHIAFTYFSPINETDCSPAEGPRIGPGEAPNVLDAIVRELRRNGLADVKLAVADQCNPNDDFFSPILEDAELMKHVGALDLHIYGNFGGSKDAVAQNEDHILRSKSPQTPLWVTEYGDLSDLNRTAENQWKQYSLAADRRALRAINQGASVLMYWDAFDDYEDDNQRLSYYGLFSSAGHVYIPKKSYYAAKQIFHFVPPGSRRIAISTTLRGLTVSAFRNARTDSLIVVGVKEGGPNHIEINVQGGEEAPRIWNVYETTRDVNCMRVGTIAINRGAGGIDLPDEVIFTLVGTLPKPR